MSGARSPLVRYVLERMGEEPSNDVPHVDGQSSLDAQVDRLLMGYEEKARTAIASSRKDEAWLRDAMTRQFLLREVDDDAGDEHDEADDEKRKDKDRSKRRKLNQIDLVDYATHVARLVDRPQDLIEFRNTLMRRAANYLSRLYDDAVVDQFLLELEENFGLVIGMSEHDEEYDVNVPASGDAGPLGM